MPLRDHFQPPLSEKKNWEGLHGLWPGLITMQLNEILPVRFEAEPIVHVGSEIEVDVATLEDLDEPGSGLRTNAEVAFEPALPSLAVETDLPTENAYEVRILDVRRNRRLVAAIEIVSPSNKDRPESRQVFVAKCQALLKQGVSVVIVDIVTSRRFNLYTELLELIDQSDPLFESGMTVIYAAAARWIPRGSKKVLETWSHVLKVGDPLPVLPLWLTETFAIPLDLETSYEQTCRALRIA